MYVQFKRTKSSTQNFIIYFIYLRRQFFNQVNNDFCSTCGGIGKFLCCETCPKSFHFTCVDPPLEEESLPDGEWLCTECYVKRQPPKPFKQNTLFGPLMNQLQKRNPRQFKLPKRIQERFEGVTIGPDGEYQDDIKPKKISTRDEEINFDKNGKPILCFKCGKSALNGIQMATCEFCNQSWHVDCLDPPALSVGSGWMCPNHTAQVVKLPRRPRKAKFVNTNLRRGFKNKGNIEVQDSSDEEDSDMVQDIPFFDIRNTEHGVSAPYPKQIEKMFSIDGVIYRLPARGIKLDFIDHVNQVNEDIYPETNSSDILMALDELSARPLEERRAVRDLCYLQAEGSVDVKVSVAHENIQRLLDVAFKSQELSTSETVHQLSFPKINGTMEEESSIISTGPSEVSRECVEKQILNGNSVSEQELRELFAVKRMMELTGKEKLMKFLLNETN